MKIDKSNKEVYDKLLNYDKNRSICFWCELEMTAKGMQLKQVIKPEDAFKLEKDNIIKYINSIYLMYLDIDALISFWLGEFAVGLVGTKGKAELEQERKFLIQNRNDEIELLWLESQMLKKVEEEELEKERAKNEEERLRNKVSEEQRSIVEEEEFEQLVAEMNVMGFTMSHQVSSYIVNNRLGDKYKHISGVLEMENQGVLWKFNGGFPPKIYAKLCERLQLVNKKTASRVIGFTSFNDLK
ncbi:hypothetical protein [Hymenobacter psychrotolerans]|uniref:hypothetical protein n=1 Tax=Hymenobacter psychrotolerans TaxID=344998 RepID=UPI001114FEE6|nr:hypothetical protein [Hymenobacter psychrotolerans]